MEMGAPKQQMLAYQIIICQILKASPNIQHPHIFFGKISEMELGLLQVNYSSYEDKEPMVGTWTTMLTILRVSVASRNAAHAHTHIDHPRWLKTPFDCSMLDSTRPTYSRGVRKLVFPQCFNTNIAPECLGSASSDNCLRICFALRLK